MYPKCNSCLDSPCLFSKIRYNTCVYLALLPQFGYMSVEIYTDSASDLPKNLAHEYDIHVIPLETRVKGEQFLDGVTIDPDTVIKHMKEGIMPQTAAPSPGRFQKGFEDAHGNPIVSVHISSGLSGTYQSALRGAENIHPTPLVIDSMTASMTVGFLARLAAREKFDGKSASEIQESVEEAKRRAVALFTLLDPKWAYFGGRIGKATYLAAKSFKIKPIEMMYGGKAVEVERVRTWEKAKSRLEVLVQSMKFADLAVLYGENSAEADEFISHIPVPTSKEIFKVQMGSTIVSYSGPVIVAACGILVPGSAPVTPDSLASVR